MLLLDVSARRRPVFVIVEAVVFIELVLSIDGTVRQGKGWCLESFLYSFSAMAEHLNGYVSGGNPGM